MGQGPTFLAGILRASELVFDGVESTWRDEWPRMELIDRTYYLGTEIDDADRYLARLAEAQERGELSAEQVARLNAVTARRQQVAPIIDAMLASLKPAPKRESVA